MNSDLTILGSPRIALLAGGLIVVASAGKFAGAFIGGAIGRLSRAEALALAIGMNARGSTEVIVASIGLSIGALSRDLYSIIVAMAVLTTCAMPPTLRWALARTPMRPGERERLEREAFEAKGFVANMERFLIAATDHPNGQFASRLAGLMAGPRGRPVTMLGVPPASAEAAEPTGAEMASAVKRGAGIAREAGPEEAARTPDVPVKTRTEPVEITRSVSEEALKGYDFLFVGLDPAGMPNGGFNPDILASARAFGGCNRARRAQARPHWRTAQVIGPHYRRPDFSARRRGRDRTRARESRRTHVSLPLAGCEEADAANASLIVLGVAVRPSEALLFGDGANRLLETSSRSLLFVAAEMDGRVIPPHPV